MTKTEAALIVVITDLRTALLAILVDGDDRSRLIAREADRAADAALRDLPVASRTGGDL